MEKKGQEINTVGEKSSPPPPSYPSLPSDPSLENALKLANEALWNALRSKDKSAKALLSSVAKSKLEEAEKIFAAHNVGKPTHHDGIASAYLEHALLMEEFGHHDRAHKSHIRAEKWGYVPGPNQRTHSNQPVDASYNSVYYAEAAHKATPCNFL
ncbi:hypothetical protein BGX26_004037 [Mortierella sp. AD094]|nr:hypothetical protein BGX26_004037 [Mortierella sp. AD094]